MARPHKYAGSHVAVTTTTSADRLAEIVKATGEATKGNVRIGINHVRFEGARPGRLDFSIRAVGDRVEFLTFHVDISDEGTGSRARSRLDTWKTKQEKFLVFIPFGPKRIMAYKTYRLFMTNLKTAVDREDGRASVSIVELVT